MRQVYVRLLIGHCPKHLIGDHTARMREKRGYVLFSTSDLDPAQMFIFCPF